MSFLLTDHPKNRFRPNRHPAVAVTPAILLGWLWEHKSPWVQTLGIDSNRWGARARKDSGVGDHGTFWYADAHERVWTDVVSCNSIPWDSRAGAYDDERNRFTEDTTLGWRRFLNNLTSKGVLRPSEGLSYLIGHDSYTVCPRRFWE